MPDFRQPSMAGIAIRSFSIWLVMIGAEVLHGITRAIVLVPFVGEFRSNQIGILTGSILILLIAFATVKWLGGGSATILLGIGLLWAAFTFVFELLFGRFVVGLSWERLLADYNVMAGGLMPVGLVVLALSPWIAANLRGISHQSTTDSSGVDSPGSGVGE